MTLNILNSASNYSVPQLRVLQEAAAEEAAGQALQAVIIGPQYALRRYEAAAEKASILTGDYAAGAPFSASWPGRPPGGVADQASARVFVDGAWLKYFSSGGEVIKPVSGFRNRVRADNVAWVEHPGFPRSVLLPERDVQVGDGVRVSVPAAGIVDFDTLVVDVVRETLPSAIGAAQIASGNRTASAASATSTYMGSGNPAEIAELDLDASAYNPTSLGLIGDTYTVVVTESTGTGTSIDAKVQIISKSGLDDVAETVLSGTGSAAFSVGVQGLDAELTLAAGYNLVVGQTWTITAAAAFIAPTVAASGTYAGPAGVDTVYIARVTRSGVIGSPIPPQITVQTRDGLDSGGPYDVDSAGTSVGNYGLVLTFSGTTMALDDQYTVEVQAEGEGAAKTLVLANSLPSSVTPSMDVSLELAAVQDIVLGQNRVGEPPNRNYTSSVSGVVLSGVVTHFDNSIVDQAGSAVRLVLLKGAVYVACRYLLPDNTYGVSELRAAESGSVESLLGPLSADNPLALGVYLALLNTGAAVNGYTVDTPPPVAYIGVSSDDAAGYREALDKISERTAAYIPVALSQDEAVQAAVANHIRTLAVPEVGRWRISFYSGKLAELNALIASDANGDAVYADIYSAAEDNGRNLTVYWEDGRFMTDGVRAGDILRADYHTGGFGDWTYGEYIIDQVVSEDTVRLMTGPSAPTAVPGKFEVWRSLSSREMAERYATRSVELGNLHGEDVIGRSRARHVFPPEATIGADAVPGHFLCAALAGLRAGVLPQQPITNVQLLGFDAVPWTTDAMSSSDLDLMAANGTWIVSQDSSTGNIYVRHQLTAAGYNAGSYREDSKITNLDSVCYRVQSALRDWTGKANITQQFIAKVKAQVELTLSQMQVSDNTYTGPQIESFEILRLSQHAVQKDKLVCSLRLYLPEVMNYLDVYIVA